MLRLLNMRTVPFPSLCIAVLPISAVPHLLLSRISALITTYISLERAVYVRALTIKGEIYDNSKKDIYFYDGILRNDSVRFSIGIFQIPTGLKIRPQEE